MRWSPDASGEDALGLRGPRRADESRALGADRCISSRRRVLLGLGLVALLAASVLLAATVAAQEEPAEAQADLMLRYPVQVTFKVWGNGSTYNEYLVEAAAGDSLNTTLLVKMRGRTNTLEEPVDYTVRMDLDTGNGTRTLGQHNGTVRPGDTADQRIFINATLPELPTGRYALHMRLESGAYDPNPGNNDPASVPVQIGTRERTTTEYSLSAKFLYGPILFAILIALPFILRATRGAGPLVAMRRSLQRTWERRSGQWIHLGADRRSQIGTVAAIAAFAAVGLIATVAHGGIGFGMRGVLDAGLLAVLAFLAHLAGGTAGRIKRQRRQQREEGRAPEAISVDTSAMLRRTVVPALMSLVLTFVLALLWQQLAAVTAFFRWPMFDQLFRFVLIGISIGAIYALIALGYTMVYGILKFINFAHGEVFMWGAYLTWIFVVGWEIFGFSFPRLVLPLALVIAVLLTGALGYTIERVAYRPLRGGSRLTPLVTAIALSLTLQATAQFFFGASDVTFDMPGSTYVGTDLQQMLSHRFSMGDATANGLEVAALVLSIVLMFALHLFVKHSRMGRAMRAVSDDYETARTIGVRVDRVISTTFFIGSALAAVGGVFFGLRFSSISPTMGLFVGIKAFTAAVVGGIGNIYGAFLGGFLIGLAENVGGQFIQSEFQKVIVFGLLIVFLLLRPQGIFGEDEGVSRK